MDNKNIIQITFPDGAKKDFVGGARGIDIAQSISKSLLKKAVAIEVNGFEQDLCEKINSDAKVAILTLDNSKGLDIMRHTLTAQVLAKALKNLFPDVKLAIGPTIENGFYYDFELGKPITTQDLPYVVNPEKGFLVNCNNFVASDRMKYGVSHAFAFNHRKVRITELIEEFIRSGKKIVATDMQKIQMDVTDV